jgi:hypothetical protein
MVIHRHAVLIVKIKYGDFPIDTTQKSKGAVVCQCATVAE